MRTQTYDSTIAWSESGAASALTPWEPLITSIDDPSRVLKFVAHWLAARVANRRDARMMLADMVYGIEPGCESSFLRNCSRAYLARVRRALLKDLRESIGIVAEIADGEMSHVLMSVIRILEATPRGHEAAQIERWIRVSWEHGVEHRTFLQVCS